MKRPVWIFISCVFLLPFHALGQPIHSPEARFGFRMGTDRRLIDWNEVSDYFNMLDEQSERVLVQGLGKTTLGRPFLLAIISSAANIRNLSEYQQIHQKIANPYDLSPADAGDLIKQGKIPVLVSMNIHSTEIGSSQESVELAYELATREDDAARHIRDNVLLLLIPSLNPDGLQMVVDWYEKYVGTPYEGCRMPWLYHHYAGHDNNRDWFAFGLQESRLTSRVLYRDWFPEIVFDQHQMGSTGARLFLPPYSDPVNLNVHTILMAEMNMLGKHVVSDLHAQGFKGVITGMRFNAFFQGVMARTPIWHNMLGILSEAASASLATPIFLPRGSLGEYGPERPRYNTVTDFLDPWEGGWWRLRDIIEYEKAATLSILDLAATYKDKFMMNFYTMNADAIEKGKTEPPYAFILPLDQHDPSSASELLMRLDFNGIRIYRSRSSFEYDGRTHPRGTFVIPLSQSCRPAIKDLLEPQVYPHLTQYPGGPPRPPYDFTGWTLQLQMGVEIIEAVTPLEAELTPAESYDLVEYGPIDRDAEAYLIERRFNNAFALLNGLFEEGIEVFWADEAFAAGDNAYARGTLIIPNQKDIAGNLEGFSKTYRIPVHAIDRKISVKRTRIHAPSLGLYQPWTASMDEGWTRLVLDNFRFKYQSLHNEDFQKGKLKDKYDAIILPDMSADGIVDGRSRYGGETRLGVPKQPEEYRGGIGSKGVDALVAFVKAGGTLITFGSACDFAIERMRLPARNVLKNVSRSEYYAPGTLLQIEMNTDHPLSYGMPVHPAIRVTNSPAFRLLQYDREVHAVGYYTGDDPLLSGWLIGADRIAGHTVLAEIPVEKGRVILIGFGVQSRAQTYGTFKILFNAIVSSRTQSVEPPEPAMK